MLLSLFLFLIQHGCGMFLVSLVAKALTGSLVFLFCHQHFSNPDIWGVTGEAFSSHETSPEKSIHSANLGENLPCSRPWVDPEIQRWLRTTIHTLRCRGSLILFMACLPLSSHNEHLVSIIWVIIHHPFLFCTKVCPYMILKDLSTGIQSSIQMCAYI